MPARLVDSHCHLDFDVFDAERDEIISRARDAGLVCMLTISTRVRQVQDLLAIAERYPEVYCSVGTHPHQAAEETDVTPEELIGLASHARVVAIGEAGLDYFYDYSPRETQMAGLRVHIAASRATGLPLIIHARDADDDMIAVLEEETGKGAFPFVLHCFSSGAALAQAGVRLGGYVSFSGIVTFRNSGELRDIARHVPRERLLIETDAPFLAPVPMRGKRNEPAFVAHTARSLADTLEMETEDLAELTTRNFFRLFSKIPAPAGAAG